MSAEFDVTAVDLVPCFSVNADGGPQTVLAVVQTDAFTVEIETDGGFANSEPVLVSYDGLCGWTYNGGMNDVAAFVDFEVTPLP